MAFTTAQLAQIRTYLGYPSVYLFQDPALEGVMVAVGNDVDASALVVSYLANVTAVLADIQSMGLLNAGVRSLDKGDVELDVNNAQITGKKEVGRMWVGMLSGLFSVPIWTDIFAGRGYQGHAWAKNQRTRLAGMG